jgi:hypothetical protein
MGHISEQNICTALIYRADFMIGKNMANSYSSVEVAVLYFAVVIIST